jgi:hypothetical protein
MIDLVAMSGGGNDRRSSRTWMTRSVTRWPTGCFRHCGMLSRAFLGGWRVPPGRSGRAWPSGVTGEVTGDGRAAGFGMVAPVIETLAGAGRTGAPVPAGGCRRARGGRGWWRQALAAGYRRNTLEAQAARAMATEARLLRARAGGFGESG